MRPEPHTALQHFKKLGNSVGARAAKMPLKISEPLSLAVKYLSVLIF